MHQTNLEWFLIQWSINEWLSYHQNYEQYLVYLIDQSRFNIRQKKVTKASAQTNSLP